MATARQHRQPAKREKAPYSARLPSSHWQRLRAQRVNEGHLPYPWRQLGGASGTPFFIFRPRSCCLSGLLAPHFVGARPSRRAAEPKWGATRTYGRQAARGAAASLRFSSRLPLPAPGRREGGGGGISKETGEGTGEKRGALFPPPCVAKPDRKQGGGGRRRSRRTPGRPLSLQTPGPPFG